MNIKKSGLLAILIFALITLGCSITIPKSELNSKTGKIYFTSNRYGNPEIFSTDVNDYSISRLTNNTVDEFSLAYDIKDRQLGYISDKGFGYNLYSTDLDGKNEKQYLDTEYLYIGSFDWSPDGNFAVLSLDKDCLATSSQCNLDLYLYDIAQKKLKPLLVSLEDEWFPSWSPDGKKIAYASNKDGDYDIFVMDQDGSNIQKLTENNAFDNYPRWSPDGNLISFESDRDRIDRDIYVMNPDGSDQKPITLNSSDDSFASWSPDGKWLVYISKSDGDNEIFVIDLDGQNQDRITNNNSDELYPIWVP